MIRVSIPSHHKVVEDNNDSYTVIRNVPLILVPCVNSVLFSSKASVRINVRFRKRPLSDHNSEKIIIKNDLNEYLCTDIFISSTFCPFIYHLN